MTHSFPMDISVLFILTTLITLLLFKGILKRSSASDQSGTVMTVVLLWLAVQAALAARNIYNTGLDEMPPKLLLLGILPPIIVILIILFTRKGRRFMDSLPLQLLTFLSVVRILVEIVLLFLFLNKSVPKLMTLEGGNLDIISGITAPLVAYYAFLNKGLNRSLLIIWNIVCLLLLLNIVLRALLSAPFPMEKLAFDQPNIAILHFPFVWLPSFIVPLILFSHIASLRQLFKK
jgi:hypothetical protein